ncbi:hypothetical protein GCM10009116_24430 [Brevundimonas basaltis]
MLARALRGASGRSKPTVTVIAGLGDTARELHLKSGFATFLRDTANGHEEDDTWASDAISAPTASAAAPTAIR